MNHSLNEIEAMAKRAARGAGFSWGMAEEAAKGSRWLVGFGLPGPEMLAALLDLNDRIPMAEVTPGSLSGTWSGSAGRLCPVIAGATMSDCAERLLAGEDIVMEEVTHPLLVVPFAGGAALHLGAPVAVEWDGIRLTTDGDALCIQGARERLAAKRTATLRCTSQATLTAPITPVFRGQIDTECWERLSAFAHRIYAPATKESRLRGAGAGLSDND